MNEIMIPTLLFWENGNSWYGSKGDCRFFIKPVTRETPDDQPDERVLEIEIWRGPNTKELSEVLDTNSFPVSDEGLEQTVAWLESKAAEMNG